MKIRTQLTGDVADVKVVVMHPMETGQRRDPATGETVQAHYIQMFSAAVNGKTVLSSQWGPAVSKNPFVGFRVRGVKAGDRVSVRWQDNKGERGTAEAEIR
jgi:sulfur-oxidizing protein SoxZ